MRLPRQTRSTDRSSDTSVAERRRSELGQIRRHPESSTCVVGDNLSTSTDSGSSNWLLQVVDGPQIPRFGRSSGAVLVNTRGPRRWAFSSLSLALSIPSLHYLSAAKGHVPDSSVILETEAYLTARCRRYSALTRPEMAPRPGHVEMPVLNIITHILYRQYHGMLGTFCKIAVHI